MPLDTRIPMMGEGIDTATPLLKAALLSRQLEQDKMATERHGMEKERFDLDKKIADFKFQDARQESRFKNSVLGALELKPDLDANNKEGVIKKLQQRRAMLGQRIASGENVDTAETDDALRMVEAGDIAGLKTTVDRALLIGEKMGFLKGGAEGFTLGEGQQRYDANGNLIASGPGKPMEAPKSREVKSGTNLVTQEWDANTGAWKDVATQVDTKQAEEVEKKRKGEVIKESALRLVSDLLKPEWKDAVRRSVGPISQWKPTVSEGAAEVENKVKQLRSILTAENIGLMTGVLSETDLKVIADIAGGGVDLGRGESGFFDELNRLNTSLGGKPGAGGGDTPKRLRYNRATGRIE